MFILIFILTLLILVLSHEFGHFLVAKRFGIKVLEFGFGIPPKIWSKKFKGVLVSLNLLPIGGFVRLLGEDEVNEKVLKNPESFAHKRVEQRMGVVLAGVIVNLALAVTLFYIVITLSNFRVIYPVNDPVIVISDVQNDLPAEIAGLKSGDRVIAVDDHRTSSITEAVGLIKAKPNKEVLLEIADISGQNSKKVIVIPREAKPGEGQIGVAFSSVPFKEYKSTQEKIFSGFTYSWDLTKLTTLGIVKIFSQLASGEFTKASQNVSGPIGMVGVTRDIVGLGRNGFLPYIWFMGVISLTLAIFNSLPFPALDGGRFAFLVFEFVFRKRVNSKIERMVHTVGMVILLAMIVLVTYSDISKLL